MKVICVFLFLALVQTSCSVNKVSPDQIGDSRPIPMTASPQSTHYSSPPQSTLIPSPSPTPAKPGLPAPILPDVSETLSVKNISKIKFLSALGPDDPLILINSSNSKMVAVITGTGISILDTQTLEQITFLPVYYPRNTEFIDNDKKIKATSGMDEYIWTLPNGKEIEHKIFNSCPSAIPDNYSCFRASVNDEYTIYFSVIKVILIKNNTGKEVYTIEFVKSEERQMGMPKVSKDGKTLVINDNGIIKIIDSLTGQLNLAIDEPGVRNFVFTPDEKSLVLLYGNKTDFWSMKNLALENTIKSGGSEVFFSPDKSIMVIKNEDYRIYKMVDLSYLVSVAGVSFIFAENSNGFSVDNGKMAVKYFTISNDRTKVELSRTLKGTGSFSGFQINMSPDGSKILLLDRIFTQGMVPPDTRILVYDVTSGALINSFRFNLDPNKPFHKILTSKWIPAQNTFGIITQANDESINFGILDLINGSITPVMHQDEVYKNGAVEFSPKSDLLVSVHGDQVLTWDILTNTYWKLPVPKIEILSRFGRITQRIYFSPNNQFFSYADFYEINHTFNALDFSNANKFENIKTFYLHNGMEGSINGSEIIIKDQQGNLINQIEGNGFQKISLDYDQVHHRLATISDIGLTVWDLSEITQEKLLFESNTINSANAYYGTGVRFSPDGIFLAAPKIDGIGWTCGLWDVNTGQFLQGFHNPAMDIKCTFSADSKLLAVSNDKGGVILYDLATSNEVFSIRMPFGYNDLAPEMSFSPDGKYLAIQNSYSPPQIWGIP